MKPEDIAFVPLVPPQGQRFDNLCGRIVTVINVRIRLGLPAQDDLAETIGVTVENDNELYTLIVDDIGEVLALSPDASEKVPCTLKPQWREFSVSTYQLENDLMTVLCIEQLLSSKKS